MWYRRRRKRDDDERQPQPSPPAPADSLEELLQAGESFLAAGDEAIQLALSGDSLAFLRSSRQHGGQ